MLVLRGDAGAIAERSGGRVSRRHCRGAGRALDRAADCQRAHGASACRRPRRRSRPRTGAAWRLRWSGCPARSRATLSGASCFTVPPSRRRASCQAPRPPAGSRCCRSAAARVRCSASRRAAPAWSSGREAEVNVASAGYFTTLRIPIIEGRAFTAADVALSKPVVVINDLMARRYFGSAAVGHRIRDEEGHGVRSHRRRRLREVSDAPGGARADGLFRPGAARSGVHAPAGANRRFAGARARRAARPSDRDRFRARRSGGRSPSMRISRRR